MDRCHPIVALVTLALALALPACTRSPSASPTTAAKAATPNESTLPASPRLPTALPTAVSTPQAWDLPVHPGATADPGAEGATSLFGEYPLGAIGDVSGRTYWADADVEEVRRFYDDAMEAAGWQRDATLFSPGYWWAQWHRGDLLAMVSAERVEGRTQILLARGRDTQTPPRFRVCTAREAYALAAAQATEWRADAYLVEMRGGTDRLTPVSRQGCSQAWRFTFYSPSEKKERDVGVGFFGAREGLAMTEPREAAARPALLDWMDSPQVYASAEAAGGSRVRPKYPDAGLEYHMTVDSASGRGQCLVIYASFQAPAASPGGMVFRALLDARTGELISVQIEDGVAQHD